MRPRSFCLAFAASVVTISLGFGAMFAANVLTPLWLQSYMGYTATWAGLATAWTGALAVIGAPMAGALLAKTDPAFRRYPVLPVRQCSGYQVGEPAKPSPSDAS